MQLLGEFSTHSPEQVWNQRPLLQSRACFLKKLPLLKEHVTGRHTNLLYSFPVVQLCCTQLYHIDIIVQGVCLLSFMVQCSRLCDWECYLSQRARRERKSDTDPVKLSEKGGIATPCNKQSSRFRHIHLTHCHVNKKSHNINHINYFTFMPPATMPHREIIDTISMRTISPRFTSRTRLILHIHFRFNFEEEQM